MRSTNSIKNAITAVVSNIVTILIGIVSQAIFIKTLGAEYLGINGLFTNIVSMLGIVELGIGSAIIYNLYEPIAKDDKEKILEKIDKHCNKLVNIGGYENEKFYKVGFIDGINLIIECIGGKLRC